MTVELAGWTRRPFESGAVVHDVYRAGEGPCVLLLPELPGITPKVEELAWRIADLGCSVTMPSLFGTPGRASTGGYASRSALRVCISRELAGLARGRSGPVVDWLAALAAAEHRRCGGPGVGVVGMCFTGGFALGLLLEPAVVAPVVSQPALPLAVSAGRRGELQLSPGDWDRVRRRVVDEDLCVLGLRFSGDRLVPEERFTRLRKDLGDRFVAVELDSSPGNPHGHDPAAHSVLTEELDDRPGTPTRAALDQVLAFLGDRLIAR